MEEVHGRPRRQWLGSGRRTARWRCGPRTLGIARSALVTLAEDLLGSTAARRVWVELVEELDQRASAQHAPTVQGVTLASLHSAKGLEWDAVFLVGLDRHDPADPARHDTGPGRRGTAPALRRNYPGPGAAGPVLGPGPLARAAARGVGHRAGSSTGCDPAPAVRPHPSKPGPDAQVRRPGGRGRRDCSRRLRAWRQASRPRPRVCRRTWCSRTRRWWAIADSRRGFAGGTGPHLRSRAHQAGPVRRSRPGRRWPADDPDPVEVD